MRLALTRFYPCSRTKITRSRSACVSFRIPAPVLFPPPCPFPCLVLVPVAVPVRSRSTRCVRFSSIPPPSHPASVSASVPVRVATPAWLRLPCPRPLSFAVLFFVLRSSSFVLRSSVFGLRSSVFGQSTLRNERLRVAPDGAPRRAAGASRDTCMWRRARVGLAGDRTRPAHFATCSKFFVPRRNGTIGACVTTRS
jgi:hypothetical protein